jgi:hypothetical protein
MSNLEFLAAFSLMPIGAPVAAIIFPCFARSDRHQPHHLAGMT